MPDVAVGQKPQAKKRQEEKQQREAMDPWQQQLFPGLGQLRARVAATAST
jgi:hypothetical protein